MVLIYIGIAILVGTIVTGVALFSPGLAVAVKLAEDGLPAPVEQQIRMRHPEIIKRERLDRHDAYVWLQGGLWCVGLGVVLAPAPTGVLTELSWDAQKALGTCIFIGSTVALAGVVLGLRLANGWRIARPIAKNLLSDLLGDDVRVPYTFGWLGLLSVGVGMAGYGWTIYQYATLIGTLGGGLSFAIAGMCITLGWKFISHIRQYGRQRNILLTEVATRIEEADQ